MFCVFLALSRRFRLAGFESQNEVECRVGLARGQIRGLYLGLWVGRGRMHRAPRVQWSR